MATSKTYPFPIVLTRDLPLSRTSLKENDSIIVIRNNTTTERIPGDVLPDTSKTYITLTDDAPSEFSSIGSPGAIAWDNTGVYTYTNGTWGKSVRVRSHWEDYTETTRFVLVNTQQNLSEDEQKIGRENLGIASATTKKEGLVRLASTANDASDTVITAGVLIDYMNNFSVPYATSSIPGVVRLADDVTDTDDGVPTAAQIVKYVNTSISGIGKASATTYGTVRLAAAMSITETGVVTASQVVTYFNNAWNNMPKATTEAYGTVILATEINETNTGVVTAQQVAEYVKNQSSNLEAYEGSVSITGPDGTELFVYDPVTKELRLGVGVRTLKIKAQNVVYLNEEDEATTEITQD